jgi:uncharacterized protein (DUF433 family)
LITTTGSPAFAGAYSSREAALYIKATFSGSPIFPKLYPQHLSWWSKEGLGGGDKARKEGSTKFINFLELVSFRMIAAMRAQGISRKDIKLANALLKEKWGWEYPFAMQQMWVGSPDIFVEIYRAPVAVTRFWQSAFQLMREFLIPIVNDFHGLSFDTGQQAIAWSPSEGVILDPSLQFGEPCIVGTRVPTETVWAFHQAGDSVATLAKAYSLSLNQIEAAIRWEDRIAESAAE